MFLVMGITGRVGGATARHLLARGSGVRALVRNRADASIWTKGDVELVDGDWTDRDSIARALRGVEGAFVMLPAVYAPSRDFRESKEIIDAYSSALLEVQPARLVGLSSLGAEKETGLGAITPLAMMERAFRTLPFPIAFIRAGGFLENFLYGIHAARGGTLPVFYTPTTRRLAMIATEDIGAEAARLLTGPPWRGRREIELASMVSPDEIATQIGAILKRDVKARATPRAEWAAAIEQMGIPRGQTWAFEEMTESLTSGWISVGAAGTERVCGTTSPADVLTAHGSRPAQS